MAERRRPTPVPDEPEDVDEEPYDHIVVRSTYPPEPDGGHRVALYEVHPQHPHGEVFIAGPGEHTIALTPLAAARMAEGALRQVRRRPARPALPDPEEEPEEIAVPPTKRGKALLGGSDEPPKELGPQWAESDPRVSAGEEF